MKKVLTVLLVIAVMFTFSFGSAFATSDYSKGLANEYFNKAMEDVKADKTIAVGGMDPYTVEYATLNTDVIRAKLLDAAYDFAKASNPDAYVQDAEDIVDIIEADDDLMIEIVAAQYAADKEKAIGILEGLSVSDYSTQEMPDAMKTALNDDCKTYVEHVQEVINDAIDAIKAYKFTSDSTVSDYVKAKEGYIDATTYQTVPGIDTYIVKYPATTNTDGEEALAIEKGYNADGTDVGLGVYKLNKAFVTKGYTLEQFTTTYVEGQDAVDAADVAAVKANIAKAYAEYLRLDNADKTKAANVKAMLDFLAEEGEFSGDAVAALSHFNSTTAANVNTGMNQAAELEATAIQLAAEKDSTGAYVRDAKDVADAVTAAKVTIYKNALNNIAGSTNLAALIRGIEELSLTLDDEKLAYMKKQREVLVADFLENAADTYYPAEVNELKALADEYLAKVNAVTKLSKVNQYDAKFDKDVKDVATKAEVKVLTAVGTLKRLAVQHANLANDGVKESKQYYLGKDTEQQDNDYAKLFAEVEKLVGNSEARTTKEIEALKDELPALVKSLPTVAEVEDAKEAAEDALEALPTTVKSGDKALLDAAIAAVDNYEALSADYAEFHNALEAKVLQYAYAFLNDMEAKVKAVDKTDKAAIEALIDEIDAFIDAYEDYADVEDVFYDAKGNLNNPELSKLDTYLADIQNAAASKVRTAIAAIPVKANLTEADIPAIQAARVLYDAYVAEYTNYRTAFNLDNCPTPNDGFVADDFDYLALFNAETLVGLNATTDADKVEALKITAKSSAKKGSITVKWTVKGDASVADGFQVWKSTKHSKGYKKAFTTTKQSYKNTKGLKAGTRYYYKVRAYKVVDGKNVYSDWSNKARRVAK